MAEEFAPKRYQYERRQRKDYLTKRLNDFFAIHNLRDVERQTHIHRSHIRSYLTGAALPSLPILAVLHNQLGLDLNELVKEPEPNETANEPEMSSSSLTTLSEVGLDLNELVKEPEPEHEISSSSLTTLSEVGLDLNELVKEPEPNETANEPEMSSSSLTTLSEAGIL